MKKNKKLVKQRNKPGTIKSISSVKEEDNKPFWKGISEERSEGNEVILDDVIGPRPDIQSTLEMIGLSPEEETIIIDQYGYEKEGIKFTLVKKTLREIITIRDNLKENKPLNFFRR